MKLIKPSIKIETPLDGEEILKKIELFGRVCYKSEDKIDSESSIKFIKSILKRGHESVIEHIAISVRIICDRGVSHEIVRHRLASYSQESTRYCNYLGEITFIIPPWVSFPEGEYRGMNDITKKLKSQGMNSDSWYIEQQENDSVDWFSSLEWCSFHYNRLIELGWTPQQARSVLPNSLKTELIMTCNLREWRHFLKLRTSPKAHPQMREVALMILMEFQKKIPVIFDDIEKGE